MNPPPSFKPNLEILKRHLGALTCERNFETSPAALLEVQRYIKEALESYGLEVSEFPFSFQGKTYSNLLARQPGFSPSLPRFIIGAHFDAVPGSPGADDNASGVACLLEVARIFAERGSKAPVEFVAFNLEEYGMVGSRAYARQLRAEGTKVAGMLSLEMVGYTSKEKGSQQMPFFLKPFYPDVGNFVGLVANTASRKFLDGVQKVFKSVEGLPVESLVLPANGWVFPDARLSDHSPFWDEGFSALLVTDTSFFRNPHYHSASDRIETLDLDFLSKITEAVLRVTFEEGRLVTCLLDLG